MNNIIIITPDKINAVEEINSIDLSTDIIISVPENKDIINFNIDGNIELTPDVNTNFSFAEQLSGFVPVVRSQKVNIPAKLYLPIGYFPDFKAPANSDWLMYINAYYKSYVGFLYDEDFDIAKTQLNIFAKTPNYMIYKNISVNVIFNTEIMKKEIPGMLIKQKEKLCNLQIVKNYLNNFTSGNIFYIQNNEIYNKDVI